MTFKKIIAGTAVAGAVLASGAGIVDAGNDSAPGQVIKTECGVSYGQLVSAGKQAAKAGLHPGFTPSGAPGFIDSDVFAVHCPGD